MNNYIERIAQINSKLEKKSLFLFGPRQTVMCSETLC